MQILKHKLTRGWSWSQDWSWIGVGRLLAEELCGVWSWSWIWSYVEFGVELELELELELYLSCI